MNPRAVWALFALVVCGGPAMAMTLESGPGHPPVPVDRMVKITSSDLIDVRSFYHRRVQDDRSSDDVLEQQLWGFTADSSLPVFDARAQLEYSVWIPQNQAEAGLANEQNRLIRLQLDDHRGPLDYGANFFSVGQAFVSNPLARQRLDAAGLPGTGDGAEFWISGHLPKLGLEPRFRRIEKSQGGANVINDTFGLSFARAIGARTRLQYLLESTDVSTWFDDAVGASHDRQSAAATLKMTSRDWSMFLSNAHFDDRFDSGERDRGWSWRLGGTMNLFTGLAVSPQFAGQLRDVGSATELRDTSAQLTVHTTWIDPVALDLQVQRDRRDTLDGGICDATAANLTLRAPLTLGDRVPRGLMMTASLGYRGTEGLTDSTPQEGMSFKVTFNYQPAR